MLKIVFPALTVICVLFESMGLLHAEDRAVSAPLGECTIAVFSGAVTADGRPIIWKNRDVGNFDQRFVYYSSYERNGISTFKFVGNCYRNDTTRIFMGANERGFAILNSDSYNLHDSLSLGLDDGTIMRLALETCTTLSDFEALLSSTNNDGRRDCWNFGCLDSTGASAMYECANYRFVKYDPLDPNLGSPGFIDRSNFSMSGDSLTRQGTDRYSRSMHLIENRLDSGLVDAGWILAVLARDLGNPYADPYPFPYNGTQLTGPPGYIYSYGCTIANRSTTSAVAIRGVRPGESACLTTIFAILGPPVLSVAFPIWVQAGNTPAYLSDPAGSPMYLESTRRMSQLYDRPNSYYLYLNSHHLLDNDSNGVYSYTLPLESWGISEVNQLFNSWDFQAPSIDEMSWHQYRIANTIYNGFRLETAKFLEDTTDFETALPEKLTLMNYPNPFNSGTHIIYSGARNDYPVIMRIYDITGRKVCEFNGTTNVVGDVYWAGRDMHGNDVSSGIYFCNVDNGPRKFTGKMLLLR
jgi:hypothetical protein